MGLKNWFFKMEKIFSNTNLLFVNKTIGNGKDIKYWFLIIILE